MALESQIERPEAIAGNAVGTALQDDGTGLVDLHNFRKDGGGTVLDRTHRTFHFGGER